MKSTGTMWIVALCFAAMGASAFADDSLFAPYDASPDHPWNKLHHVLFVRELKGKQLVHKSDPLLYRGDTFLFAGDSHHKAIKQLNTFLASPVDPPVRDPVKRLFFQRDLWAAFDYSAWYPDNWVLKSEFEAGAIAIRERLAKAIGPLTLDRHELAALPDNYAQAIQSKAYAAEYDRDRPERPFLPPDLFDEHGNWVRFHEATVGALPMTRQHFEGAGGRAAHLVFLRLPQGRAATVDYLKELRTEPPFLESIRRHTVQQFPEGTMVAMVRRPLVIDKLHKLQVTPITELVQIRVYRRIPHDPAANFHSDFGEQDAYEFILNRSKLFAGEPGLEAAGAEDESEPRFGRSEMSNPFGRSATPLTFGMKQLQTCIQCHQAPGIYSMLSMERGLRTEPTAARELFRTYSWDVDLSYTVRAKVEQYNWGMLHGMLEAGGLGR